jgi:hypothetical protein
MASDIRQLIARAIKKSDKSYFFENYSKQARAVLKMLADEGYAIVPLEPDKKMIEQGVDQVLSGSVKPETHVLRVYRAMIAACDKGGKR